ncbi:receptor-like protein EIX2 [Ziziphus jujuba]|uniref:Receptor-like protein EIX2 n=1 Tax=Ziziphus jujuba TaxID=326968 RepID=A0ABM4A2C0_ZIZJJ|nr:receptor-like protein EIX2 [Ziziphus jujuba]
MVSCKKVLPMMETIRGLPLMLLIFCFSIIGEFLPNTDAETMNCLKSDREALIDFKNGLHDPENWLSSWKASNCCQWRGITCENTTGAVIAVDLHNPHLQDFDSSGRYELGSFSGEIRPSLTKLKSLRHLDLSFNTFDDNPIPEFFGSFKNLQYLNLSNAGFSGPVPPNLGNLSSLQYLDLESLSLLVDNLAWVKGLVSLKHLVMNEVDLSEVGSDWIKSLTKLPFLTELHLSDCSLSGTIPPLIYVNLTSLVVLDLSYNKLNSKIPNWLVNVTSLVAFDITLNNFFGRIPLGFSNLPNLQSLILSSNYNLTASCYQLLRGRWEKIRVLDLGGNKLHGNLPASVGNMTFLTYLNLGSNKVEGEIPSSIGKLCNLMHFLMSGNNLTGTLPEFLEGIENCLSKRPLASLLNLDLSQNHLVGKLPQWLSQLKSLVVLSLARNELNGTLPESLGQLPDLSYLDVSSNNLMGIVTETHFSKLGKLNLLYLSSNSFTVNISSSWVPPFQLWYLDMHSCHLGPSFPAWLKSQKQVITLDFSDANISGSIPNWFWEHSSSLLWLNVSYNLLEGRLPSPLNLASNAVVDFSSNLFKGSIPLSAGKIYFLDVSKNKFSGIIPDNISGSLVFLSISGNQINGEIPASIGNNPGLQVIDLSNNNLTGSIPSSFANCFYIKALDLSNNNLSGKIPAIIGYLSLLQTLHLNDNKFSGVIPSSFQNLASLETLDLGNNRLIGRIPPWIGKGFERLRILSLRANAFSGELPPVLSNLSSIQVLDLARNQFHGGIPASFGDFKALKQKQIINHYLLYGMYGTTYYKEKFVVTLKDQSQSFSKILSLLVGIDLSGNNLSGDLPREITKLSGLVFLNLSRNHISGHIPESISKLEQLSSLDLSSNKFSGAIPRTLASLSFLGFLNLSNNNFSGRIPYTDHMSTFDAPSFAGNTGLCGIPLDVKCPSDDDDDDDDPEKGLTTPKANTSGDSFVDKWFCLSIGLGFAAGILVPYLVITMKGSWSVAYFDAVERVFDRILYLWLKYRTRQQRNRGSNQRR